MNLNHTRRYTRHIVVMGCLLILGPTLYSDMNGQQAVRSVITGLVTDAENGDPLVAVNVYLSFTTIGTSTDSAGAFTIINVPVGVYELVVSLIGYERQVFSVRMVQPESLYYCVRLKPHPVQTGEVWSIGEDPKEWRNNLETFVREFVGKTKNSHTCKILNPEILNFQLNHKTLVLRASSDSTLKVENLALGYRLYIELTDFEWNLREDIGRYLVYPRFKELEPHDAEELSEWKRNRERSYEGSLKHFLRSLYDDRVRDQGFLVYFGKLKYSVSGWGPSDNPRNLSVTMETGTFFKRLRSNFPIGIQYKNGSRRIKSIMTLNEEGALFDASGNLLNPASVALDGDWSLSRVAELLPFY